MFDDPVFVLWSKIAIKTESSPLSGNQFMFFCKGTWKNTLYVHFKCILLHSRIFAVLVHWEISKKNGNWKQNVPNSCTVHRVFMILKSIVAQFKIFFLELTLFGWCLFEQMFFITFSVNKKYRKNLATKYHFIFPSFKPLRFSSFFQTFCNFPFWAVDMT